MIKTSEGIRFLSETDITFFTDSRCPINWRTGFTPIYGFVQYVGIFARSIWENKLAVFPGFKSRCEIDLMFTGWRVPNPGSQMTMVCHRASCAKNPRKHRLWISSVSANSWLYILPILLNFLVQMAAVSVSVCGFDWIALHSFFIRALKKKKETTGPKWSYLC